MRPTAVIELFEADVCVFTTSDTHMAAERLAYRLVRNTDRRAVVTYYDDKLDQNHNPIQTRRISVGPGEL